MENTKFIFEGTQNSNGQEMQLYCTTDGEIFMKIYNWESPELPEIITLNKLTAAKLVKVLKREISKIQS